MCLLSRWGKGTEFKHGGFFSGPDKYNPKKLVGHKWESATTVDKASWGNRRNIQLKDIQSTMDLLTMLVEVVSCGGNLLLNVGPTKEGTIIPIFEERLTNIGDWLKVRLYKDNLLY